MMSAEVVPREVQSKHRVVMTSFLAAAFLNCAKRRTCMRVVRVNCSIRLSAVVQRNAHTRRRIMVSPVDVTAAPAERCRVAWELPIVAFGNGREFLFSQRSQPVEYLGCLFLLLRFRWIKRRRGVRVVACRFTKLIRRSCCWLTLQRR